MFKLCSFIIVICLAQNLLHAQKITYLDCHKEDLKDLRISTDGKWIATAGGDDKILLRTSNNISEAKIIIPEKKGSINIVAFSPDNLTLYATGGLEELADKVEDCFDFYIKYDLTSGTQKVISNMPLLGGKNHFHVTDEGTHFTYLSGDRLCHVDIQSKKYSHKVPLKYQSEEVAVSPNFTYAFNIPTSKKKVEGDSTYYTFSDPCRLLMSTKEGKLVHTEILPAQNSEEYLPRRLHFVSDNRLLVISMDGKFQIRDYSPANKKWTKTESASFIPHKNIQAVCNGISEKTIWVSYEKNVSEIDLMTGKTLREIKLEISDLSEFDQWAGAIPYITLLPHEKRLLAGLANGKLAVIELDN